MILLHGRLASAGTTQATYTLQPATYGLVIAQRRTSTTSQYHFDALGSTRQLTAAAATVSDGYRYQAFGELLVATGATRNPFQYVGQLQYYRHQQLACLAVRRRLLEALLGRWLSEDPLSSTTILTFEYADNNPILFTDPSGLKKCKCPDKCWKYGGTRAGGGFVVSRDVTNISIICRKGVVRGFKKWKCPELLFVVEQRRVCCCSAKLRVVSWGGGIVVGGGVSRLSGGILRNTETSCDLYKDWDSWGGSLGLGFVCGSSELNSCGNVFTLGWSKLAISATYGTSWATMENEGEKCVFDPLDPRIQRMINDGKCKDAGTVGDETINGDFGGNDKVVPCPLPGS